MLYIKQNNKSKARLLEPGVPGCRLSKHPTQNAAPVKLFRLALFVIGYSVACFERDDEISADQAGQAGPGRKFIPDRPICLHMAHIHYGTLDIRYKGNTQKYY